MPAMASTRPVRGRITATPPSRSPSALVATRCRRGESVVRSARPRLTSTRLISPLAEAQLGAGAAAEPLVVERLQARAGLAARGRGADDRGHRRLGRRAGCRRRRGSAAAPAARARGGGRSRRRAGPGSRHDGDQSRYGSPSRSTTRSGIVPRSSPKSRVRTRTRTGARPVDGLRARPHLDRLHGRLLGGDPVAGGELARAASRAGARARSSATSRGSRRVSQAVAKRSTASWRRSAAAWRASSTQPAPAAPASTTSSSRIGTTGGRRRWRRGCPRAAASGRGPCRRGTSEKLERRRRRTPLVLAGASQAAASSSARRIRFADTCPRVPSPCANWLTRSSSSIHGTSRSAAAARARAARRRAAAGRPARARASARMRSRSTAVASGSRSSRRAAPCR